MNVQQVYIFIYFTTTFMSSNFQSSQVKLYKLNTLRNIPCSPLLANSPSQPCMAVRESLVLWLRFLYAQNPDLTNYLRQAAIT